MAESAQTPEASSSLLLNAVLSLYTGSRKDIAETMATYYSEDASFDDPLVRVRGRTAMEAQFLALKALFVSASVQHLEVLSIDGEEQKDKFVFSFHIFYRPSRFLADKGIPIHQTTTLHLAEDGRVQAHIDEWHNPMGILMQLPAPLSYAYDTWRRVFGHASSAATWRAASWFDRISSRAAHVGVLADKAFSKITAVELSAVSILEGFCDLRGLSTFDLAPNSFQSQTAMIIGDLDEVSLSVASRIAQGGAASLYLASSADNTSGAAAKLDELSPHCSVTPYRVNFRCGSVVDSWCSSIRKHVEDNSPIDLVVLGSFTNDTESLDDGARQSDLQVLQALLHDLKPVLASRARVIVVASAASQWLSSSSAPALHTRPIIADESSRPWQMALYSKAAGQAARVQLARMQGQSWSQEGLNCVSCTPGGWWGVLSDAVACTEELRAVQFIAGVLAHVPGWRALAAVARAAATSQAANTVLQLCDKEEYISPGAHYWGQHRLAVAGAGPTSSVPSSTGVAIVATQDAESHAD